MATKRLEPIHPGEILEEEFMRPLGLSGNALARRIDVPVTRISEIVRGKRGITADTALRLGRLFGTSSELWLGLQAEYDLRVARRDFASAIENRVAPLRRTASRYGLRAAGGRSHVGEPLAPYGAGGAGGRGRDRRRLRRSSDPEAREQEKKAFFELADRLVQSSEAVERRRLKDELARIVFGE
jgi:addiction module HigA family antidote